MNAVAELHTSQALHVCVTGRAHVRMAWQTASLLLFESGSVDTSMCFAWRLQVLPAWQMLWPAFTPRVA
jgi:hypothetical protein